MYSCYVQVADFIAWLHCHALLLGVPPSRDPGGILVDHKQVAAAG
jgi:hypothetical protein